MSVTFIVKIKRLKFHRLSRTPERLDQERYINILAYSDKGIYVVKLRQARQYS